MNGAVAVWRIPMTHPTLMHAAPPNLDEYGRLYNWYAVDDSRGLPKWLARTLDGGRSDESQETRKTDYGWGDGNGTNLSGFSGLPGGYRVNFFGEAGNFGGFWFCGILEQLYIGLFQQLFSHTWHFCSLHSGCRGLKVMPSFLLALWE